MVYYETQSPLCGNSVKYCFCDHELWEYYSCLNCKKFFLWKDDKELLLLAAKEVKLRLSENSRNNTDTELVLVIESVLAPNQCSSILHAELRNRNELPMC